MDRLIPMMLIFCRRPNRWLMTEKVRHALRRVVQLRIVPALEQRGFRTIPLTGGDARSREIRSAFPFGRLRREGIQGFQIVEIQLDKRGRPAFRLNLGVVPQEGIVHASGRIPAEDVWVQYLEQYFQVYRRPFFRHWFDARRWLGSAPTEADIEATVDEAVTLMPEIEEVFVSGTCGPHVRCVGG